MGNDISNPVGTDFNQAAKDRKKYHDVDIPDIPLTKLKEVSVEVAQTLEGSKYMFFYKKEVRAALKRKRAKGHEPKLFRLYDKCLCPSDEKAGRKEDRKALMARLVKDVSPYVKDDFIQAYRDEGLQGAKELDAQAVKTINRLIFEYLHEKLNEAAEKTYRKYLKGKNYHESDGEDEVNEDAKKDRATAAARTREHEAECWLAELTGEAPPDKEDDGEEEEEWEEFEEEEDEEVEEFEEEEEKPKKK